MRRIRLPNIVEQQNLEALSVKDEHYSIWMLFFELYNENILDLLVQLKDMKIQAEDIIKFSFADRLTSKTNLNEAPSRAHAVVCIVLITANKFDEEPIISHVCICDLTDNEPTISSGKQLTETYNINKSIITFKDSIRVSGSPRFEHKIPINDHINGFKKLFNIQAFINIVEKMLSNCYDYLSFKKINDRKRVTTQPVVISGKRRSLHGNQQYPPDASLATAQHPSAQYLPGSSSATAPCPPGFSLATTHYPRGPLLAAAQYPPEFRLATASYPFNQNLGTAQYPPDRSLATGPYPPGSNLITASYPSNQSLTTAQYPIDPSSAIVQHPSGQYLSPTNNLPGQHPNAQVLLHPAHNVGSSQETENIEAWL
ncbi:unnamed protein product [Rotaria sordida]|uniref:Kinesin motor domain-containing protein n=1 Tax=Rotaria sordida TaxID=392033 RepID=A0A815T232_9BILA|nr:unnamed protein product [Rotaria sordida]CAF1653890.1 unnamed protein product [Rotaria sordida]